MLPLLTPSQTREADAYTIAYEPIASIDLMERASKAFVAWFINHFPDKEKGIAIYCGTGNNGGDGLAIARLLYQHSYHKLSIKIARFSDKASADFNANLERLKGPAIEYIEIQPNAELPEENAAIIIDALLGSGLNKPLYGDYARLVDHLNTLQRVVVAVDVPTGFFVDSEIPKYSTILKADVVISFQLPKLNFLLPESVPYIDCWEAVNIGLNEDFIQSLDTSYYLTGEKDIRALIKPRKPFDHKGTYGHALIIAGQPQTMGAALLSSSACAHTGAGLTTACIPESGLMALNAYLPELMAIVRHGEDLPDIAWDKFSAIAIGPGMGMGTDTDALTLLQTAFTLYDKPMVIDADALNLLADNHHLFGMIPRGSIITPHMKEFDRLFGEHKNWWHRLETIRQKANEYGIYILLKNRYTMIGTPEGKVYFNPTGNPAMSNGGMGDVLTGVIVSLLAQRYTPQQACIIGVYLHGKAGDDLVLPNKLSTVLPGQIIVQLPVTLAKLIS